MPFLPDTLSASNASAASPAVLQQLRAELAASGLPAVAGDSASLVFDAQVQAQVSAFQQRYLLPGTGAVDPTTGGVLALSALVATQSDHQQLRTALRAAQGKVPDSPLYNYWLARYAILAGDYDLAMRVRPLPGTVVGLPGDAGLKMPDPPPQAPEVPFPENFYAYQFPLVPDDTLTTWGTLGASAEIGIARFIARQRQDGGGDGDVPPGPPMVPDPPPTPPGQSPRAHQLRISVSAWVTAVAQWQAGGAAFKRQAYGGAVAAFTACQQAAITYFASYYPQLSFTKPTLAERIAELVSQLATNATFGGLWVHIGRRREFLSLQELGSFDWDVFTPVVLNLANDVLTANGNGQEALDPDGIRQPILDAPLLIIAAVLAPLARAEANRLRRQFGAALADLARVSSPYAAPLLPPTTNTAATRLEPTGAAMLTGVGLPTTREVWLTCDFIERPFARLLQAEMLLDQATAQYKARARIEDEPPEQQPGALAILATLAGAFVAHGFPGADAAAALPFQHLVAACTYGSVIELFRADGEYVARADQGVTAVSDAVKTTDPASAAFGALGKGVTIPTIQAAGGGLPGLDSSAAPHAPYLTFQLPPGQSAMREQNPRVYAILLEAHGRLLQLWSGFNFLGYRDDYVPPWRFAYLLDRARYFTEHAMNAQRDYLNFLANAENEEFKELSAGQNVELETSNVQIETARVDQAQAEVKASQESANLADRNAGDAQTRLANYKDFESAMAEADTASFFSSVVGGIAAAAVTSVINPAAGAAAGIGAIAGAIGAGAGVAKDEAQREMEQKNLELAIGEAQQASKVAQAQLAAANAGLVVAGIQRQAALLRHEFALQNLAFIRNQTLNAEQWYRLAGAIRSVSDTYLRYAIEMAFLAQQAYAFESDRRLSVIRFDYDLSAVGAMLAGDFLLRDLDTLEQDLVVSQQARQQQVRYVLSLAREYPEALRDLADRSEITFNLRLEQLERHFPGLFNLRILSVELMPVALMDPTRVTAQLTQIGAGLLRLKAQPDASPLNTSDGAVAGDNWLASARADWPVKVHLSAPQTTVFSGLSRQDSAGPSMIATNERGAFEGLPAASGWKLDLSATENQIVPGSLADVVITFVLSGYYDASLRQAVAQAAPRAAAITSSTSARAALPDAYYSLSHTGTLDWTIDAGMLVLAGTPGALRNLAVLLPLARRGVELGRCSYRYPIEVEVAAGGSVSVLTLLPTFSVTPSGLTLTGVFNGDAGVDVSWDFGDGTPLVRGGSIQHRYARSGQYALVTRLARNGTLVEYRSALVVSEHQAVVAPLIAVPSLPATATVSSSGSATVAATMPASASGLTVDYRVGMQRTAATAGAATLSLPAPAPGQKPIRSVIEFLATRTLTAHFYSKQRYLPEVALPIERGRIATNRTLDAAGVVGAASPNPFTAHLFGDGTIALSPVDRWTLELPLQDNPWFQTVSSSDVVAFDGSELDDAILVLEYIGPAANG